jgi:hypothetical protein
VEFRGRLFIEAGFGAVFGGLAVLTLLWPRWIELAFGLDPDGGGGGLERMIVVASGLCAAACLGLARRDWPRSSTPKPAR